MAATLPEAQSQPERIPHYSSPSDVPSSDLQIGYYLSFEHWYHVDSTSLGGGDGAWLEYRLLNGSWGTGPSSNPPPDTPARCLLTARMSVANHQVRCQFSHLLPTVAGPQMRLISQQSPEYQSQTRSNLGSGCGHTHPPRTSGPVVSRQHLLRQCWGNRRGLASWVLICCRHDMRLLQQCIWSTPDPN